MPGPPNRHRGVPARLYGSTGPFPSEGDPRPPARVPDGPNKRAQGSSPSRGCAGAAMGWGSRPVRAAEAHRCPRQAGKPPSSSPPRQQDWPSSAFPRARGHGKPTTPPAMPGAWPLVAGGRCGATAGLAVSQGRTREAPAPAPTPSHPSAIACQGWR